jgi:NAD(P)-dependent dehydrogenase (short-subunit alcohol dehydrogenase family)
LKPAEMFDLTGKVAVITGGSRGIGRAIAHCFASAGAEVLVASRKLDSCVAAAADIRAETGQRVEAAACHVGHWDDCERLVDHTVDTFGRLDILVNNAGISPLYPSLMEVTEELYDKTLAVNLKGPFRLGVKSAAYMAEHDGGSIINVGSIGSAMGGPTELPYACAKAGLNTLTVGLAQAFAPKVRVNAILPGPVLTDITDLWTPEMKSGSSVPLKRIGEPAEIAALALYLASEASSFTTGAIVRVDGGALRRV